MRKIATVVFLVTFAFTMLIAQEEVTQPPEKKGGLNPCLASACIGPRVGLEMNEGKKIQTSEWIGFGGQFLGTIHTSLPTIARGYMAYDTGGKKNGVTGFFASYFLGPRVGLELQERKIRKKEWLKFCIIGSCLISWEAYQGKTMTEIEVAEGLRKG